MYHIGIVREVIGPGGKSGVKGDASVQAIIRMWDENLLIISVDKKLSSTIKEKDYVIADYTPLAPDSPHRKMVIVKIVPQERGKRMWKDFQDELGRKKARMQERPSQPQYPYIR